MALVIIDMQAAFDNEAADVEDAVLDEIRRTKYGEPIFVVHFGGCGEVFPSIREALKHRPNVHWVRKSNDDGAAELWGTIVMSPIRRIHKMRFCGVWTSQCVGKTFLSMCKLSRQALPMHAIQPDTQMELVQDACQDTCPTSHHQFLLKVRHNRQANVRLVERGLMCN